MRFAYTFSRSIALLLLPLATTFCAGRGTSAESADKEAPKPFKLFPEEGERVRDEAPFQMLRRGVNLGNGFDAPKEGAWGVVLGESHFSIAAAAGLDHIRLPIRFNAHAGLTAPYTIDQAFWDRIDWAVSMAEKYHLQIIIDFHHYMELMEDPDAHSDRFVALWGQISEHFKDAPETVLFEILNEPNSKLDPVRWDKLLRRALVEIRRHNPNRWVVVDCYFWANPDNLETLHLPEPDPRLIASFHMYQPIMFTHQGAPWMGPEYQTTGVVFPGPAPGPLTLAPGAEKIQWVRDWFRDYAKLPAETNPNGPATIQRLYDMVTEYEKKTQRPIYMGEFGAIDKADPASRVRYLRMIRVEAEKRGWGWAYWDDGGNNRGMDIKTDDWVPDIKAALFSNE